MYKNWNVTIQLNWDASNECVVPVSARNKKSAERQALEKINKTSGHERNKVLQSVQVDY